jgi:hypothetical protein
MKNPTKAIKATPKKAPNTPPAIAPAELELLLELEPVVPSGMLTDV